MVHVVKAESCEAIFRGQQEGLTEILVLGVGGANIIPFAQS
jgi:hypothetical protein